MERFVWVGPVRHLGGYGEVARNYVRGLDALGADVALVDSSLSHPEIGDGPLRDIEALLARPVVIEGATVVYHAAPPDLPALLARVPAAGAARRVACTITECERLPADWVAGLAAFDEVWVPGTFHVESFVASGVPRARMRLVPYGVDTAVFRPGPAAPASGRFRFLYTFQFDWRKGFDLLLEAYLGEFSRDEPTELVVKVFDTHPTRRPRAELIRSVADRVDLFRQDLPLVTVLDEPIDRAEMIALYRSADLYVSTDRANGWGMPCHEAMACGRAAAAIDWSGSTEFMHAGNALPIPAGELVPVDPRLSGSRPEYAGLHWPHVEVGDVRRVLRQAFSDPVGLRRLADRGRREILTSFSLPAAAAAVLRRHDAPHRSRPGLAEAVRESLGLPAEERPDRAVVGWAGPLAGGSGYASAGRGMVAAARAAGHVVRALPLDADDGTSPALDPGPQGATPGVWVLHCLPVNPDGTQPWRTLAARLDGTLVGAACFEAEGLPPGWTDACELVSEVWVPSPFNMRTFAQAGVDPGRLHLVPYPVDCTAFSPAGRRAGERGAPFTFLSVFEWTWRKGWDALLQAFVEEFDAAEPVRLQILTGRRAGALGDGDVLSQATRHIVGLGRDPEAVPDIQLLLDPVSREGLIGLYRAADAFVLASRGEGMGMPVLEAMASGVPVVATATGGYEHLLAEETAFPVELDGLVPAHPSQVADNPLYAGLMLAEPSVPSLRRRMREAFEDREGARRRAVAARDRVERTHGSAAAAAALDARLVALSRPGRRGVAALR